MGRICCQPPCVAAPSRQPKRVVWGCGWTSEVARCEAVCWDHVWDTPAPPGMPSLGSRVHTAPLGGAPAPQPLCRDRLGAWNMLEYSQNAAVCAQQCSRGVHGSVASGGTPSASQTWARVAPQPPPTPQLPSHQPSCCPVSRLYLGCICSCISEWREQRKAHTWPQHVWVIPPLESFPNACSPSE